MNIDIAKLSAAGPRPVNEDFVASWIAPSGSTVVAIADGLGGMGGGDLASRIAIEQFKSALDAVEGAVIRGGDLVNAAWMAHFKIRREQEESDAVSRMATTLTAISIHNGSLVGVHCGDSRAVISRGGGIRRLTRDHSEGQRLYDAGKLSREELAVYGRKHILESALGDVEDPKIEKFQFDLMPGDRIFLTTDGVHNLVFLRELKDLALTCSSPSELVRAVERTVEERGAIDNYSVISIYLS